jgi:diguanylate cyclase (GGDEF)-like protein/PAS domain S-box-containing protein
LATAYSALDGVSEGIIVVDTADWQIQQINAPAAVMLDLDRDDANDMRFDRIRLRLRADDGSVPPAAALLPDGRHGGEYRYVRVGAPALPIEVRSSALESVRAGLIVLVVRDVSERVRAANELCSASARCGITFSQAATGLAHVTLEGRWCKVNPKLTLITGYDETELLGMSVREVTHPDDVESEAVAYQRLLEGDLPHYTREKLYVRKDGSQVWVSVTSSLARNDAGEPLYFIGMVEDISERKRAEERVHHLASHDAMTGLPNRHGLQTYLEKTLLAARHGGRQVGVVFVDMDKLKQINDTLGHEQGDLALIRFARQLQQQVRSGDIVARIGGDEFVIVLAHVTTRADISAILERTLLGMADAEVRAASLIAPSCSIGISVFPDDGKDARTLIRNADMAMYRAKQRGGARYEFFSDEAYGSRPAAMPHTTYART